jgi:hypothetical protein
MRLVLAAAVLGAAFALPTAAHASCITTGDGCIPVPCIEPIYDQVDHALNDKLPNELFACLA